MRTIGRLVLAASLISPIAAAQSTPPVFEAASIRVNNAGRGTGGVMTPRGSQWRARDATVRTLVRLAYGSDGDLLTPALLDEFLVVGGPAWIDTEAFDIVAVMPEVPNRAMGDSALMLRALLAERFKLKVHTETRALPAYTLVRDRADGRPGPELRASSAQCAAPTAPAEPGQTRCRVRGAFQGIIANGVSMTQFAAALTPILGRKVYDRTALPGIFDFNLRFADDSAPDPRFPSLFTAVREQLGLKLEPTRESADIVVVDGVQRPAEN
jgi:uncharacterized protein (TIGR03435 family)